MTVPETFNWRKLVFDLRKSGMTVQEISCTTGFTRQQIIDMESGSWEPDWIPILKLLDLYYDLYPNLRKRLAIL